jgi:asparagine N-glycosylation enzyme membrane subunit Stt3
LLYEHVLMKATAGSGYSVDVGVEWYPYEAWDLFRLSVLAFVIFIAGLAAFEYRRRGRDLKPLFFLLVALVLLLMAFKSRRFIEYWPPFAVLFAAFTISPRLAEFDRSWFKRTRERAIAAIAAAIAAVVIGTTMMVTVGQARADMKAEPDPYEYQGASQWIAANVPAGAMVFNTDWDDFPMLYYYNPNNPYIVGLDPTYLYDRDPELWKLYARITLGEQEDPAALIRERFGAEYVFTDNQHPDFLENAAGSGKFETVYTDAKTTVLRIRSAEEIKKIESERQETGGGTDDSGAE